MCGCSPSIERPLAALISGPRIWTAFDKAHVEWRELQRLYAQKQKKKKKLSVKIVEDSVKMKRKHASRTCEFVGKMICHVTAMFLTFMGTKSNETRQSFPV